MRPAVYALSPSESSILAQARSMLDWNARHRFCPACGSVTFSVDAGYKRKCSNEQCDAQKGVQNYAYPRTDAVCILQIISADGERCLLGRKATWPPLMYSCIAGFVEPGETLEDAARREAKEETGVVVGKVVYHSSQVWPFPSQLMLGCVGWALSEVVERGDDELEDARWFSRHEAKSMVNSESACTLPKVHAIAHHLVKAWVDGGYDVEIKSNTIFLD